METTLDMKGLDKSCECNTGAPNDQKKLAVNCCRKDEACPCGSKEMAKTCCLKREGETGDKDDKGTPNVCIPE